MMCRLAGAGLTLAVSAVAGLGGCADERPAGASTTERDSAGIRIVDNIAAQPRANWRVSAEPTVEIGAVHGSEPAALLDEVVGAVRLADGRIVIANGGTRELRFFSPDGQPLKSAGRQGQGPGEFRWLMRLQRIHGDTIIASDRQPGRLLWFDAAGEYLFMTLDSIRGAEPPFILMDGSLLEPLYESGGFGGEWESFAVRRRQADADAFFRPMFDLVRIPREAAPHDTIGRFRGLELFKISTEGPADVSRTRPFARGTITGFGPNRIFVAHTGQFEIQVYDDRAALTALIRKPARQVTTTQADRDAFAEQVIAEFPREPWRTHIRRWLDDVPWPETKPPLRALVGDADGNLWVAEPAPFGATTEPWSVFDTLGSLLAYVDLPAGLEVFEIGGDYVLGLWRDPLGVEFVRLYALNR